MSESKIFTDCFKHASQGVKLGWQERNMKIHVTMAGLVIVSGLIMGLDKFSWFIILILIGSVISAELFNTAIEDLANLLRDEERLGYKTTKQARDLAAGAVFVVSIVAAIIGSIIFLNRLLELLGLVKF